MGQECAIIRKPGLFDKDAVDWASGDQAFEDWFAKAHHATKAIRAREPHFSTRELAVGVVLNERTGRRRPVAALLNLDGRSGKVTLPHPVSGRDILSGCDIELEDSVELSGEPVVVELEGR
jgi:hypothetical protein